MDVNHSSCTALLPRNFISFCWATQAFLSSTKVFLFVVRACKVLKLCVGDKETIRPNLLIR